MICPMRLTAWSSGNLATWRTNKRKWAAIQFRPWSTYLLVLEKAAYGEFQSSCRLDLKKLNYSKHSSVQIKFKMNTTSQYQK